MSTKDTFRERRRSVAVRRARTSDKIDAFPFCRDERDQKRERNTRDGASSYTLKFLVRFCFPAEILFADRNSYTRKKERKNDEVYSSLLLSSIINSSSLYIVLMNYVYICRLRECIARAVLSVSRSYSSRDSSTQRTTRSNSISRRRRRS